MFDVPVDGLYVWVGLGVVGVVALGVVAGLPDGAPPGATAAADAIDAVDVGPPGAHGRHAVHASEIRLGSHRVALEGPGGRSHAAFAYGPIVPVRPGNALAAVLAGRPASAVFDRPAAFGRTVERARNRDADWRPAPERLAIRRVRWGRVDVTLVG